MAAALGAFTLKTNVTPDIVLDPNATGARAHIFKILKPTLTGTVLGQPVHVAPWGEATEGAGELVVWGLAALVLLGAWSILRKVL